MDHLVPVVSTRLEEKEAACTFSVEERQLMIDSLWSDYNSIVKRFGRERDSAKLEKLIAKANMLYNVISRLR